MRESDIVQLNKLLKTYLCTLRTVSRAHVRIPPYLGSAVTLFSLGNGEVWYCSKTSYPQAYTRQLEIAFGEQETGKYLVDAADAEPKCTSFDARPIHIISNEQDQLVDDATY